MIATFESLLPIFLLIIAGNLLRRSPLIDQEAWTGLEQIGFWFLYPALLFASILKADFSRLALGPLIFSLVAALTIAMVAVLALWPVFRSSGLIDRGEFSTVYQTALRWNGFMALAIAQKLFPPEGVAVVALSMAAIVIPINLVSVLVVTRFGDSSADWGTIGRRMATNPLVLSATAGLLARFIPGGLYGPLDVTLDLVARAALGMGLIAIGAGLRPSDMFSARPALWIPVAIKLVAYPALLVGTGVLIGVEGQSLMWLALCGSVPTAMNGYLLAKQLGGDAPLYAATVTMQTAVSFFSIPAVLAVAGSLAG
ncbi:transporter [Zhengella mangrovi]|uniref:Transporter n=1 Tax=Zhengella mangrovi TaxID=1982044 RepID=A0A2G1QRJ1_9HYPH|nr:AEC family transporter [Zhengella mangrovi]PHP68112.1 transporter [Zhengella mangrovi]